MSWSRRLLVSAAAGQACWHALAVMLEMHRRVSQSRGCLRTRAHSVFTGILDLDRSGSRGSQRDLEQSGRDEVRVMTIHGAKGLEAPIVILPDTVSTPATHSPPILWHNELPLWPPKRALEERICRTARATAHEVRDREYRRLLYVAMSRAEDRLYVCGWHGIQKPTVDCWYNLIVRGVDRLDGVVPFEFHEEEGEGWSGSGLRFRRNRIYLQPRWPGSRRSR